MREWLSAHSWRGFAHVLGGNTVITVSQGLQFFILARALGPHEFGRVAAAAAVAGLLAPYSGLGAANVLIMRAARDPSVLSVYLGNAFLNVLVSGTLLGVLACALIAPLLGGNISVSLMAIFVASELLAGKLVDVSWHAFLARQELRYVSLFLSVQSACRLVAVLLFVSLARSPSAEGWALCALASNLLAGLWVLRRTTTLTGRLRFAPRLALQELGAGASFAVGISARNFYTDADKVFLAHYTSPDTVGQYTTAFRVVQIALVPARSLSATLQARLFQAGEVGIAGSLGITKRLMLPMLSVGLLLAGLCFLAAPLLPLVAGAKYEGSSAVLRFFCLLPALFAVQSLLHDTLASSGHQRLAAACQVASACAVCVLSVLLIPRFGWRGAGISSYLTQAILSMLMLLAIYWCRTQAQIARPIERLDDG
jgi:O-antigen/teichoic acid export membrane protein